MAKINQPKIQMMAIDKIAPYDKNAKIHTESQVESLVKVIKSQGWDVPIVVDRYGVIIKGHGRRLAALSMGLKEVPVIVRDDLTDEEVKAARLSDNRVAMGDFDVDMIRDELAALKEEGFDLNTTGFGEKELSMMLGSLDSIDDTVFDVAPIAPEAPVSSPDAIRDAAPSTDAPAEKALLVSDLLGFKHVPAKYKNAIIEFMAKVESSTSEKGAEAFGKAIEFINKEEW